MKILVLQHADVEHPGSFRKLLQEDGHSWDAFELDAGEALPPIDGYDALWVMGGPMDVWQEDEHPWLKAEKAFIRDAVEGRGVPFLGLCLGHQLLAEALDHLAANDVVKRGLPGDSSDEQARWIEATVIGKTALRICGLYLPNGNPAPGPKFDYKLAWMDRLAARAAQLLASEEAALMTGDYNIIPLAQDAARPESWTEDALFRPEARAAWRRIANMGFTEAFRARTGGGGHYSFWDYQAGAWERGDGIRIDHFLMTPQCADMLLDCQIDTHIRGRVKPSDHVPVWVDLDL